MKKYIRFSVCSLLSILSWFFLPTTTVWLLFLFFASFFMLIDIFNADKNTKGVDLNMNEEFESNSADLGVLGRYIIDSTESYGLFLKLSESIVFVDIKEDKLVKEREDYALELYKKSGLLEYNLKQFIRDNPSYSDKTLDSVGIYGSNCKEAETFWTPDGHGSLSGDYFNP